MQPYNQPYQQQPRKRTHWSVYLIVAIVLLVVFVLCGRTLYRQQFDNLLRGFEPSCSVSSLGATITVQGWSANDDCQQMLYGGENFTGAKFTGAVPASEADGGVVCEQDIDGRHVTVRGNAVVCGMLDPIMPMPGQ